jgi:hypothetical protein
LNIQNFLSETLVTLLWKIGWTENILNSVKYLAKVEQQAEQFIALRGEFVEEKQKIVF